MDPIATRTTVLPPSSECDVDELLATIAEIVPAGLSRSLIPEDTAAGELYLPCSWIYALHKFARRRYYDDRKHANRLPRQLPTEEAWVHCCKALGANWKDGTRAETPHAEVAVVYDAIRAREGDVYEYEFE